MKAVSTSSPSVSIYQTTRRNIPEDSHIHIVFLVYRVGREDATFHKENLRKTVTSSCAVQHYKCLKTKWPGSTVGAGYCDHIFKLLGSKRGELSGQFTLHNKEKTVIRTGHLVLLGEGKRGVTMSWSCRYDGLAKCIRGTEFW
jgi:hypothetical protein